MPRNKRRFKRTVAAASAVEMPEVLETPEGDHTEPAVDGAGTGMQALSRGQKAALSRKRNQVSQAIDELADEPMGTRHAKANALKNAIWKAGQGPSRKRATPPMSPQKKTATKKGKTDLVPQLQARTHRPPIFNSTADDDVGFLHKRTTAGIQSSDPFRDITPRGNGGIKGKAKATGDSNNGCSDGGNQVKNGDEQGLKAVSVNASNAVERGAAGLHVAEEEEESSNEEEGEQVESDGSIVAEKPTTAMKMLTNERPFWNEKASAVVTNTPAVKKKVAVFVHNRIVDVSSDEDLPASPAVATPVESASTSRPKPRPLFNTNGPKNVKPSAQGLSCEQSVIDEDKENIPPTGTVVSPRTPNQGDNLYWSECARLYLNSSGDIALRIQSPELRVIIQSAIHKITSWIIFKDAFPTLMTRAIWNREALMAASKEFMDASHEGPLKVKYRSIRERVSRDPGFVKNIGKLPDARISIYRGAYKSACVQIVANYYDLKEGLGCAEKVTDLVTENKYIFRLTPSGQPIGHKPFEHPAIVEVIKERLFDDTRFPISEEFPEFFKDGDKLTPAIVAFAATTIRAAIQEWSSGKRIPQEFTASAYTDIYLGHMSLLNVIQKLNPRGHEHLLMRLFRIASSNRVKRAVGTAFLDIHRMQTADSDV